MNSLKPNELRSIQHFFQLKKETLLNVMHKYLKSKYQTVHRTKDYIIAVGDIPVALLAHLDTVFETPPEEIFYDKTKNVMWSPEGLGADDRAGVYSIVQIIKKGFRPTVIFTMDEEMGALGASELVRRFPKAPTELKYVIELDRRNSLDCVFYDCYNPKFEEYVESFGFVTAFGSFTDISVICPNWEIAGVNLSIGYRDEHTYQERLYIGHMNATINKVVKMLQDIENVAEPYKYVPAIYTRTSKPITLYDWDPSFGISKEIWDSWHNIPDTMRECSACGAIDYDYNLFPVKALNGNTLFLCCDCVVNDPMISWCQRCKEPFITVEGDRGKKICYDCEKINKEKTENGNSEN